MTPRRACAPSLLLAVLGTAGCSGKGGAAGDTIGHRAAGGAPAGPTVTLADDIAELRRAAGEGEQQRAWPERSTFLGWTADHRAAYRILVCNPDELGGRGPYCELRVCTASATEGGDGPACEDAAQFELYGEPIDFDAGAATAAAEAATRALGPLAAGTPRPLDGAAISTADLGLVVRIFDAPHALLPPGDDGLGADAAHATYVGDSPDGRCRVVLGDASVMSEYEGVRGHIPYLFAAVGCR